jgi:hypothetical protein
MTQRRPRLTQSLLPQSIPVAVDESAHLVCMRCFNKVALSGVAMMTRTGPLDAFECWCVECAYTFTHWALTGAIADDFEPAGT